jgi:heat shock protein HtpX
MFSLHARMALLIAVLFAIIYSVVVVFGTAMGVGNFNFYLIFAIVLMFIQYLVGPKIVEWSMHVKYVEREQAPEIYDIIADQARKANIPMPRVCVSAVNIPNAFAFGRGVHDGRVCVTEGIVRLLNKEELQAVIGHEITHIKNRDVLTITLLSVIPMIMYRMAWHFLFYGGRRDDRGQGALLGLVAFLFYFLTNLLVLYASRIREYFADKGSIELGNHPSALATALYKLVYGSARVDKQELKEAEGLKAFFINDPSRAYNEIRELSQLDRDHSGSIDESELLLLRGLQLNLTFQDKMMEALSTHPNMLKRIQHLSELSAR